MTCIGVEASSAFLNFILIFLPSQGLRRRTTRNLTCYCAYLLAKVMNFVSKRHCNGEGIFCCRDGSTQELHQRSITSQTDSLSVNFRSPLRHPTAAKAAG